MADLTNLIHYSEKPIPKLRPIPTALFAQEAISHKPPGFWVSDNSDKDCNWKTWCEDNNFCLDHLKYPHKITLTKDSNVLVIDNFHDLLAFHDEFKTKLTKPQFRPRRIYKLYPNHIEIQRNNNLPIPMG